MKVFVTGTEGYIGIMLAHQLLTRGFDVIGLDAGFYRAGWLYSGVDRSPAWIRKDIRQVTVDDLRGVDAVIHLAELSNDPLGQLNPEITFEINHKGSLRLARLSKEAGVSRFVYSSSCSVYGLGSDDYRTEESETDPQTAYAKCKVLVEQDVSLLADDDFSPVFLRNGTAYGPSPRMRFDIVLNNLAGLAWTTKEIARTSDDTPWRPMVHVLDICEAMIRAVKAPRENIHNQVFNVGDTNENYRIREIALIVKEIFPNCKVTFGPSDGDDRSYRVSFEKVNTQLPGFECKRTVKQGAEQLKKTFEAIDMTQGDFVFRGYTRLKQLEYLIRTQQIDSSLFWN